MFRRTVAVALAAATVLGAACDEDSDTDEVEDVDTTIVDDPNVPFDPDVPAGVDPGTNEVENQGFDPDDPGPEGNVSELPADD
jgi:hypothetical protein